MEVWRICQSAAKALVRNTKMQTKEIVKALEIASSIWNLYVNTTQLNYCLKYELHDSTRNRSRTGQIYYWTKFS